MRTLSLAGVLGVLAGGLVAGALGACKGNGNGDNQASPAEGVPSPAASAITIANALGTCDDVSACDRECTAGQADSCRRLGVTYEFGKSDAGRNETLGTQYFDRSCALGDAPGCVSSGQMHEYGHGVPKDFPQAAQAYAHACTLGWQVGCANWAIMLGETGAGWRRTSPRRRRLYDVGVQGGGGARLRADEGAGAGRGVSADARVGRRALTGRRRGRARTPCRSPS